MRVEFVLAEQPPKVPIRTPPNGRDLETELIRGLVGT
jgi:hypothetical protein